MAKEYILFKCLDCGIYQALADRKADGHRCIECYGRIKPVGKYPKEYISSMFQTGELGEQEELIYFD